MELIKRSILWHIDVISNNAILWMSSLNICICPHHCKNKVRLDNETNIAHIHTFLTNTLQNILLYFVLKYLLHGFLFLYQIMVHIFHRQCFFLSLFEFVNMCVCVFYIVSGKKSIQHKVWTKCKTVVLEYQTTIVSPFHSL